jgi:hypothetical protein
VIGEPSRALLELAQRAFVILGVPARHRERVPGLGVIGRELDRVLERRDRVRRPAPPEQARPQHAPRPRRLGLRGAREAVRRQRLVVVVLELPSVPDQDPRPGARRPQLRDVRERVAGARPPLGGHLGPAERHPRRGLVGIRLRRDPEVARRLLELAAPHRAPAVAHRAGRASREQSDHRRGDRLTRGAPAPTIGSMTRELLLSILEKAPGVSRAKDGGHVVAPEHRAALYLVTQGHSSRLEDVAAIRVDGELAIVETTDRTVHYLPLAMVQGLSVRAPRETSSGRTGF